MDSELQEAFAWVDSGPVVVGAKHIVVLAEAARKYANLTESGLTPASQCVFPLVKEELLVYPTIERVSYGGGS